MGYRLQRGLLIGQYVSVKRENFVVRREALTVRVGESVDVRSLSLHWPLIMHFFVFSAPGKNLREFPDKNVW